ncbi:MAG: hypothetical protein U0R27_05830 [Candidatus Nanopelagicales bacterium]
MCASACASRIALVGTVMGRSMGFLARGDLDIASLDHAMWFHAPFRADEWLLFATSSPVSVAVTGSHSASSTGQTGHLSHRPPRKF